VNLAGLKGRSQIEKSAGKDWKEELTSGIKNGGFRGRIKNYLRKRNNK